MSPNEPIAICEHCNHQILAHESFRTIERNSGPSTHTLYFHQSCWKCPKCGTSGPHFCPADIARN